MTIIGKISDLLVKLCKYFLTLAFGIMTLVTLLEVIRRYIFGASYPWAEELVRFLLVWATFIGGSIAFKKGELVYLDLLHKKLSMKTNNYLKIFNSIVILGFLILMLVLSTNYTLSKSVTLQMSPGLGIPMSLAYMSIPLGFFFMTFFCIENFLITAKEMKGGNK